MSTDHWCSVHFCLPVFFVSCWIVSIVISKSSLISFSLLSNMLLIPSSELFTSSVVFSFLEVWLGSFLFYSLIMLMFSSTFPRTFKAHVMAVLLSLSTNSAFVSTPLLFFLIIGHIFLLLCMPTNVWLNDRHCDFYTVVKWILVEGDTPLNILGLCESQLSYLGIVWSFQGLLWNCVEEV